MVVTMWWLAIALAAYLIGSISFAVVVSRCWRLPDPRTFGSKNPGATNVMRTGRKSAALFTLLGDTVKGWFVVWAVMTWLPASVGAPNTALTAAVMGVMLGHVFPLYHGFTGGKGVATALGVLLALSPALGVSVLGVWLGIFLVSRISSLSALLASVAAPILAWYWLGQSTLVFAVLGLSLLLLLRHKENIRNLLAGREGAFRQRKA